MNDIRLDQPVFGWMLLLALPLLGAFFFWSWRVKQKLIARFVQARLLPTLTVGVSPARQKFRLALLAAAVAGVLMALAGPQWGFAWEEATQHGLDIIVAVDTSRSMLAADAVPNRLEKVKLAAFDLMRLAKDDRLGLVAFAGSAFLQCPLTLDDEAFRQGVAALSVGIIPQGGTALSEAIRTAQAGFEKGNNNHKVLVLFTDGEDHDAGVETLGAAKEAAEAGMKIFTVGVGTAAGELLRVADDQGNLVFVKDDDGNVVKSHLNESLLQQIATTAGGFYLPLLGANPMETLYNRGLAPLPKSESTTKLTRVYHERYHWFLGFAVVCLALEILLPERARSRRSQPSPNFNPNLSAPPVIGKTVAIACLLLVAFAARASTPGAFDKYQSGDYQGAFDEYNRLAGLKTNDYRLHYNAGTAAYRAKELDAAEKQLGAALNSPEIANDLDTQERTYFNLGNTLYQKGEQGTDPKEKQERWEQAVTNFSHSIQLNTNDADARNNLAFVKKKLQELKQQQQQQQSQDNKDQKDQKQDQNKDQNKPQNQQQKNQDQKNQDQKNQQNQQDQQQKSAKQDQQNQKDKSDQQQAQDQKGDQDKQKQDQQKQQQAKQDKDQQNKSSEVKPGGDDQRDKSPDQNQEGASMVAAQMTRQQAQQMLDAQKDDEKALIFAPDNPPTKTTTGKFKDW